MLERSKVKEKDARQVLRTVILSLATLCLLFFSKQCTMEQFL